MLTKYDRPVGVVRLARPFYTARGHFREAEDIFFAIPVSAALGFNILSNVAVRVKSFAHPWRSG